MPAGIVESIISLREKCLNTEFSLVCIFPCLVLAKYRPEKTPYSETFHAVFLFFTQIVLLELLEISYFE